MFTYPSEYHEGDLEAHSARNPRTQSLINYGRELKALGVISWSLMPASVTAPDVTRVTA